MIFLLFWIILTIELAALFIFSFFSTIEQIIKHAEFVKVHKLRTIALFLLTFTSTAILVGILIQNNF